MQTAVSKNKIATKYEKRLSFSYNWRQQIILIMQSPTAICLCGSCGKLTMHRRDAQAILRCQSCHHLPRESKRKNWIISGAPVAPVFDPQVLKFLVVNKKKAGFYAAFVQHKVAQHRMDVIDRFPGAFYVEPTTAGVNVARKTVFGTLAENDGPTVSYGTPTHRGFPAEARQAAYAKRPLAHSTSKRKFGPFAAYIDHMPLKKRKK
jgi:ribosomal protein L37AE/L43A